MSGKEQEKKKGGMKKQVKGIICLSAVLAVLGGGFAYLKLTEPENEDSSSSSELSYPDSSEGAGIRIVADSYEEGAPLGTVKTAKVKNADGEMKIKMLEPADEEAGTSAVYTLDGCDDLDVDTAMVGTLVNNGNGLESSALIEENCKTPERFGLKEPQATVEFTYESGNVRKFYVGDKVPTGSGYYVMAEGNDTVYTAASSLLANYVKPLKDFIESTILEKPEDDDMPRVDKLTIERDDIDYDIVLEYDKNSEDSYSDGTSSTHKMTSPVETFLSGDRSGEVVTGMFGLSAKDIYAVHCKESDIAEAGLSEPFCRVTMKCDNGKSYVLYLSELFTDENGEKNCYAMMENGKVIYIVSESSAKWLTVKPEDIMSRIMIASYVWNVRDLNVKCSDGSSAGFTVTPIDKNKALKDSKAEDFKVTKNGEEFDSERYRKFYAFLISANAEELAMDVPVPEGEPMAEITFKDSYDNKEYTYQFYDDSVMRALIAVNGEAKYYCTKSFVTTLIDNVKRLDTGEDYVTTW